MQARYQDLGDGIFCIDTDLYRDHMAACYLIVEGNEAAFIDTGTNYTVPYLMQVLEQQNLSPAQVKYVIPTHVHLDHAGGAGTLMQQCPNATLITHAKGTPHMIEPSRLQAGATVVYGEAEFAEHYGDLVPIPSERVQAAEDNGSVTLNGRKLTFLNTAGHANHHICIFDELSQSFFTGDTFGLSYREFDTDKGAYIYTPSTPVAFDPEAWFVSLDRLMRFNPKAMQLTHYGRVTEVERLCQDLRANIQAFVDIALAEEDQAKEGRTQRIEAQLKDLIVGQIHEHGCTLSRDEILKLLAVDINLNSQGLEVWLQRRAKARASA